MNLFHPPHLIQTLSIAVAAVFISACSSTTTSQGKYPPLATAPSVNVPAYMGTWYEQALIPNRFQNMCIADTQATYALKENGTVSVTNRCRKSNGQIAHISGVAKTVEGSQNSKLRVSFFRPFYADYWILEQNTAEQWVLVGEPTRRYAWVLARQAQLPQASLSKAFDTAQRLGYDSKAFKVTSQTQPLPAMSPAAQ